MPGVPLNSGCGEDRPLFNWSLIYHGVVYLGFVGLSIGELSIWLSHISVVVCAVFVGELSNLLSLNDFYHVTH